MAGYSAELIHLTVDGAFALAGGLVLFLVKRYIARRDDAHAILLQNVAANDKEIQRIKIRLARCKCADQKADD